MGFQILPSKLVDERITVRFEFMDEMEWAETVSEAEVRVEVASGVDTSPELLLHLTAVLGTTSVRQQVQLGEPGVIYILKAVVTGSTGAIYEKTCKLAILPSDAINPPINATFYTSRPYPAEVIDAVGFVGGIESGTYKRYPTPIDELIFSASMVSGTLRDLIIDTETLDELSFSADVITGELYGQLVTYADTLDAVSFGGDVVSGDLVSGLITTDVLDSLIFGADVISGTLA